MFFSFAKKSAGASMFVALMLAGGCSDPTPATPQVAIPFSQMGVGTEAGVNDGTKCLLRQTQAPWVQIGDAQHPVKDGDSQGGAAVGASCTVRSTGASVYRVEAVASLAGQGSLTITGTFADAHDSDQNDIRVVWQRGDTGQYIDDHCTANYRDNRTMGVAGGRVWASIICPHARNEAADSTCQGQGEFKFENCAQ